MVLNANFVILLEQKIVSAVLRCISAPHEAKNMAKNKQKS